MGRQSSQTAPGPTRVDVLLTHSYCLRLDHKQRSRMRPYPPLALLYAASLLRSAGYSVGMFDSTFADPLDDFAAALRERGPRYVVLFEDSFNFVIKMCLSRMRQTALDMAEIAIEQGAEVLAAGPDVTDHPRAYLERGVRFALLGEAELTLRELLDVLTGRSTKPLEDVEGICWLGERPDRLEAARRRAPERHPDRFPFPAWDLVDVETYRSAWMEAHGVFSVNLVTTRGCPYQCNWCAKPIWGQQYAMRSPANVAEETAMVKHTVRPDHIWFADDIFGLRPSWIEEFASEVESRSATIPFMIQTRVDRITDSAAAALKRAGCVEVWMGAESGSQRVLDAMDKSLDAAEIAPACQRLRTAGLKSGLFLQLGYPGETLEDIMATVRMVRACLPDQIGVSVSYPLPGTRFYDRVAASMGPKSRWSDSGDLAMIFSGPYTSPFYRQLHALLHRDLEARHMLASRGPDSALAALDDLNDAWFELGRTESSHRNPSPSQLAAVWESVSDRIEPRVSEESMR